MSTAYYNNVFRKLVIGFGNLFNNITLIRFNADGTENERFLVPIAYAPKELYVQRLEGDPLLDKKVQITLPRMSFEMTGFEYDSSRKQNTNIKNISQSGTGLLSQYNPVPYNFDFSLYIYTRNITDVTQIVEHILPFFTPDYTIKLNLSPDMGIVKEVPVVFHTADKQEVYEGSRDNSTRLIIWTLTFTAKAYLFGASSTQGVIKTTITNILSDISPDDPVVFNMAAPGIGNYKTGEVVYQGYSLGTAAATGVVKLWANGTLTLVNTTGNFTTNVAIYGASTNANYVFSSYNQSGYVPTQIVMMATTPNPNTANIGDDYTYTTTIQESGGPVVVTGNANNQIIYAPPPPEFNFTEDLDLMQ